MELLVAVATIGGSMIWTLVRDTEAAKSKSPETISRGLPLSSIQSPFRFDEAPFWRHGTASCLGTQSLRAYVPKRRH